MECWLRDNRTGNKPVYQTKLSLFQRDGCIVFRFMAQHSQRYCPYRDYNENHYEGDACEVFLEVAPNWYYEIELSPENGLFLAKINHLGFDDKEDPVLNLELIDRADCFVKTYVEHIPNGYIAEIAVDKAAVYAQANELRFNAFRIETDGGERDKHLFALSPTMQSMFHVPDVFVPLLARYLY